MINGKPNPHGLHIGTERGGVLSRDFTMGPVDEAVTQTFAILAKKGGGKSYTGSVIAEEMLKNGRRICVFDPTGAWWGLRSSSTGRSDGYPVVIFGGLHADIPLNPARGRELGEFVAAPGPSIIIDVSDIRKGQLRTFAADFFEALYEGKNRQRDPIHLFVDEADLVAPQRVMAEEARMVGAIEDIVRRGRIRGLGSTLITQRSAVLNWDVLSQVDTLIALRTTAPLDRKRMAEWVADHDDTGTAKEAVRELDRLPIGTAWVWSPGWLQRLVRVEIRKRDTFDSGATPKGGAPIEAPTATAKVDIAAIRTVMEATFAEAEANDPKRLKARIAELERQLAGKPGTVEVVKEVPVPVLRNGDVDLLRKLIAEGERLTSDFIGRMMPIGEGIAANVAVVSDGLYRATEARPPEPARTRTRDFPTAVADAMLRSAKLTPVEVPEPRGTDALEAAIAADGARLGKAERMILTALAQFPGGRTGQQVALMTGYSGDGGGFRNALGRLRKLGIIEGPNTRLAITELGRALAGDVPPAPTGPDLLALWLNHPGLGKAERAALDAIVRRYPNAAAAADVGPEAGYAPEGGGFRNALGKLRTLGLIEGPNTAMRASEDLI